MVNWYVDEGLKKFDEQWLKLHPGATIYHIGDVNHSSNPDVSQHAPDKGGSAPGDDRGEVDAGDYMQGKTVSIFDLRKTFSELHESRDPRLLLVILEDKIFSSVSFPWEIRKYTGAFHSHLHISVNDKFDKNTSDWEALTVAEQLPWDYEEVEGAKLPRLLKYGMEDQAYGGWNHIVRAQALLNIQDNTLPDLDPDGVYGAKTAQKAAKVFKTNGRVMTIDNLCLLHGFNK